MTELKTLNNFYVRDYFTNKIDTEEINETLDLLRQEAIKWLKVMNKEDWDNRTYITDVWKDFFNITDEDLKGDEKEWKVIRKYSKIMMKHILNM